MLLCLSYVVASDYIWLCGLTIRFNFGVLELHMFVLWFFFCSLAVAVLSILAGAGVMLWSAITFGSEVKYLDLTKSPVKGTLVSDLNLK
jgi:hypothetical protein